MFVVTKPLCDIFATQIPNYLIAMHSDQLTFSNTDKARHMIFLGVIIITSNVWDDKKVYIKNDYTKLLSLLESTAI